MEPENHLFQIYRKMIEIKTEKHKLSGSFSPGFQFENVACSFVYRSQKVDAEHSSPSNPLIGEKENLFFQLKWNDILL